jgi:catalase
MLVHANNAHYSPNTLNNGFPKQATQQDGRGFFTSPHRRVDGRLQRVRAKSLTADFWSQPRLFYNSLLPEEQQFLVNAIRFETSHLKSPAVKKNVVTQLNKIHHRIAREVAETLGVSAPEQDRAFYHENKTVGVSMFDQPLRRISGLKVGILATTRGLDSQTISRFRDRLNREGVTVVVVAEQLIPGVDATYSASDATDFDAIVVANGAGILFQSPLLTQTHQFPAGRPTQILQDAYRFGKPIGFAGDSSFIVTTTTQIPNGPGVFHEREGNAGGNFAAFTNTTLSKRAENDDTQRGPRGLEHRIEEGLRKFRYLNRFRTDQNQNSGVTSTLGIQRNQTEMSSADSTA